MLAQNTATTQGQYYALQLSQETQNINVNTYKSNNSIKSNHCLSGKDSNYLKAFNSLSVILNTL